MSPIVRRALEVAAPLPALLLGVVIMRQAGLSPAIWGQNLGAGLIVAVICCVLPRSTGQRPAAWWPYVLIAATIGLLVATHLDAGMNRVHRWIQLGPLRMHVAAICLPVMLIALERRFASVLGILTLALLALQPDAAQATAFAAGVVTLLICSRAPIAVIAVAAVAGTIASAWTWLHLDTLQPVPHVEGIVGLTAQNGPLWQGCAVLALALLPLPFLLSQLPVARAVGLYFIVCLLAPLFGAFPVPIMGFGLSPILGYFLALAWFVTQPSSTEA